MGETKPFPTFFHFFFEKRLLAPAASPFFNSIPEVVKKKATFFARKRI